MKATRNSIRSARWAFAGLMLAAIVPLAGCDLAGSMFALAKTMEGGFGERSSATRYSHVLHDANPEGPVQTAAATLARQNLSLGG